MKKVSSFLAALLCSTAVHAQDIIGFDVSSFGDIVLKRDQFGGEIKFEAAFGDYNNEPISTYSAKSVFAQIGRSVGRLDVATDVQVFPCTAFLVEEDLLMTNHHCVPGILDHPRAGASAIIGVKFVAGYTREGVTDGTRSFLVNPIPVETNKDLDYTLLRIIGDKPGRDFGTLRLAARMPEANDPYWIIGHPMGEAQRISREKCRANAPAMSEGRLLHTCDTLPGNSGSPVIDASSQQVIGLHNAGSDRNKINYGIPMSRILQASSVLKAAPGPVDPEPKKDDRETLARRALADVFALPDDAQVEAGLVKLVAEFSGTAAARAATRRLERFERQRMEAEKRKKDEAKRKRADEANAALLAAIVITDIETKRATLKALIERYPDTPVVAPARSMLASLKDPEPVIDTTKQKKGVETRDHFIGFGEMLPEGTTVTVRSISVYDSPSATAAAVTVLHGDIVLGRHAGAGWYSLSGRNGQYIRLQEGTKVAASTAPVKDPVKRQTAAPKRDPHPEGTTFKISSAPLHIAPSTTSKTASYVYGVVTIGKHVTGNWYGVEGRPGRYVQIPDGTEIMLKAAAPKPKVQTNAQVTTSGMVLAPGTTLRIKSLQAYVAPRTSSKTLSYIYGTVTVGRHVRDNWYGVDGKAGRYVQIPVGTEIVNASATAKPSQPIRTTVTTADRTTSGMVLDPGTRLKIKSLKAYSAPRSTSKIVSYISGSVTVGRHVRNNWYGVDGKAGRYVQIPVGTEIVRAKATASPSTGTHAPGTKVKIKSAATYDGPSTTANRVSFVYGLVTVGAHVRGEWYEVYQQFPKRYVQLPRDAQPVSAKATNPNAPLRPGTRLNLRRSLPLYKAPTSTSSIRKRMLGSVTIGQSLGDNWYSLRGEQGYVQLTQEIISESR